VKYFSLILKNSLRNRRRSLLTIGSIAFSLCLLGLMIALYDFFYFGEPTAEQALRLVVRNRVSLANPLPLSYQQRIAETPGVKGVMIFQWFGGTYKDARDPSNMFARFAIEPAKLTTLFPDYRVSPAELETFQRERTACLVGRKLARRHGFEPGGRIVIVGDIFDMTLELTVRGFYDSIQDNENLFFHWDYLREGMRVGRMDMTSTFFVRAERAEDVPRIAHDVDEMFRNSTLQTKTESEQAFALSFLEFLGNVKLYILSICGAVTFTILLVSGNTMAMTVRERVREVGVLKTLGYTPGAILGILLGESVVISLIGGLAGLGMASAICSWIRTTPSIFADLSRFGVPLPVQALCLVVAALIGVASCSAPAWGAARRPIVEALRFND